MLKQLKIENYALIEHLEIDFSKGFSVITGETGAGKSIIMGALSLVLGQRADSKIIQSGKKKCIVEAVFDVTGYGLESFVEENDLDYSDELVVRREVLDTNKSRAFVNDTPTTLNVLKDLTCRLVDIHSQHANLLLSNDHFQMDVVDSVAGTKELRDDYGKVYLRYSQLKKELESYRKLAEQGATDREYLQYQYNQLTETELVDGEQEELERDLDMLNHAEEIKVSLSAAVNDLDGEESSAIALLKESSSNVQRASNYVNQATSLHERLESCRIEVKDIVSELGRLLDATEFDPRRKEEIEDRLNTIYSLEQKHRVTGIAELLKLQEELEAKLGDIDSYDEAIERVEKRIAETFVELESKAKQLTDKRKGVVKEMVNTIVEKLHLLGIPNANFDVKITEKEDFTVNGKDNIEFLFSANKNAILRDLKDVASGGEMSRVMLSIKSLILTKSFLPTIIFDEIDTGISGEIAHRMGEIMRVMSKTMQVISITHLPQIAAKGNTHYKVYKVDTEEATYTKIVQLNESDRVVEIAELLSGKNPTSAALENAKELLAL